MPAWAPTREQIEAGALGIMNERLRQSGMLPIENMDTLYPHILLELMADAEAALKGAGGVSDGSPLPADPVREDLLVACKAMHQAIDILFAMLIVRTPPFGEPFTPTKCGQPWAAIVAGNAAIARAEGG